MPNFSKTDITTIGAYNNDYIDSFYIKNFTIHSGGLAFGID